MKYCFQCDNTRWVCETHSHLPWQDSPRGCKCGAPGDPCPICNKSDAETLPARPDGFVVDKARDFDPIVDIDPYGENLEDALARIMKLARRDPKRQKGLPRTMRIAPR
jgi:hypothetical protein